VTTVSRYDAWNDDDAPWRSEPGRLRELYVDDGLTMEEIADIYGCGTMTISRWLARHGIESRDRQTIAKRDASRGPASIYTNNKGKEIWTDYTTGKSVQVSRLLAVAEYGFDAVVGNHVHHKDPEDKERPGPSWLNYADLIEVMDPSEHIRMHKIGTTQNEIISERDCEYIRTTDIPNDQLADGFGVWERTIRRHQNKKCHHFS